MPRGMHPNSRKALEENRNKNGFTTENAVERAEKSHEARRAKRTFREEFEAELEAEIILRDKGGNEIGRTTVKNAITKTAWRTSGLSSLRSSVSMTEQRS